ncbi:MAG: RraA family protein [Deltaproteobacteria bacterium]|nr:RraA family protein [Deltaproteobacteria bacterium]
MDAKLFDDQYRSRFLKLSTTNLSDAMDKVGVRGAVIGIRPMYDCPRIVGRAVTIKITAAGMMKSKHHLGVQAIDSSEEGDIIIIDNRGDLNNNCWGEVLSMGAKMKGVSGVVVDGAARDIDMCKEFEFPVYARGTIPITARGRIMQESFNEVIRIGDVQVRPGDIVIADVNGVVVIPVEKLDEVLGAAEDIFKKEAAMVEDLKNGLSIMEVDHKYSYENMLKKE